MTKAQMIDKKYYLISMALLNSKKGIKNFKNRLMKRYGNSIF